MTLDELNNKYYFHDSIIRGLECQSENVILHCNFCDFMQKDYKESDFTNSDIVLTFHNATYKLSDIFPLSNAGILTQKISGNTLTFCMENGPDTYGELEITADSIEVTRVRSYNL